MKALLIYNPVSGKGNFLKRVEIIKEYFVNKKWVLDIHESKGTEDLIDIASKKASEYDVFLVSGGDGTISNVVNGMMTNSIRPRMLVLPTGTANDFSNILGIKKRELNETLALLETDQYRAIDIYKANDKYFTYAAAIGKFTYVSYDIKRKTVKRYGHLAYMLRAIVGIPDRSNYDIEIIKEDGKRYDKKSFLTLILAGKRVAGFNFKKLGQHIKLDDGKFELFVFGRRHYFSFLKMLFFYFRKGKVFKNDLHLTTSNVTIKTKPSSKWNLDGEFGFFGEARLSVEKKAIEVYASEKSIKENFSTEG